jgi:hypothetical protein
MKNELEELLEIRQDCESCLLAISQEFNQKKKNRIYILVISEVFRNWTDILSIIFNQTVWKLEDENKIINEPKKIPEIMKEIMNKLHEEKQYA